MELRRCERCGSENIAEDRKRKYVICQDCGSAVEKSEIEIETKQESKRKRKSNFTSNFLGLFLKAGIIKGEISDGDVSVLTLHYDKEPKIFEIPHPSITYNKFEKRKELVEPDIKIIERGAREILKKLNIEIVSVPAKIKFFKGQTSEYQIRERKMIPDGKTVLDEAPYNHFLRWDRANHCIQLIGRNCYSHTTKRSGMTDWLNLFERIMIV